MGMLLLAVAVGLVVGAVVGLVGAGGAIIAVPALVYLVGLPPHQAVPTSLIVVGLSALAAVLPRARTAVDWPLALIVGLAGFPASWAGAWLGRRLDPDVLMLVFAAVMVLAGLRMALAPAGDAAPPVSGSRRIVLGLAVGLAVGFLTGLLGVGGGFLIIPALTLILHLPAGRAVGTSLAVIVMNSASGFAAHVPGLALDWPLTALFAGAAVLSSLAATGLAARLDDRVVARAFAAVIFAVAAWVGITAAAGLASGAAAGPVPDDDAAGTGPSPASVNPQRETQAEAPPLTATLAASRLDAGELKIQVTVRNRTGEALVLRSAVLRSVRLAAPAAWTSPRPEGSRLPAGGSLSLPIRLDAPNCGRTADGSDPAGPDGGGGEPADVELILADGTGRNVRADDVFGDLAELQDAACLRLAADAVAVLSPDPLLEVAPDRRSAVVRVRSMPPAVPPVPGAPPDTGPSGAADSGLTLRQVEETTLLREDPARPWPDGVPIPADRPEVFELGVLPARCDAHALAEDKLGTRIPVQLEVGGRSGTVRLEPAPEFTAAVYAFVREACALRDQGR